MFFFTSDLHFDHKNIIKYCNRPFESVEEMNETIISNFNKTVRSKDTCYILGDIMMYNTEHARECLSRLHGNIYLVRGNHDPEWQDDGTVFGWIKDYFKLRWDHQKFILCHYPFISWDGMEKGSYHLHGHQHNKPDYNIEQRAANIKRYDVGVDANGFKPVSIERIIAFFKEDMIN